MELQLGTFLLEPRSDFQTKSSLKQRLKVLFFFPLS